MFGTLPILMGLVIGEKKCGELVWDMRFTLSTFIIVITILNPAMFINFRIIRPLSESDF